MAETTASIMPRRGGEIIGTPPNMSFFKAFVLSVIVVALNTVSNRPLCAVEAIPLANSPGSVVVFAPRETIPLWCSGLRPFPDYETSTSVAIGPFPLYYEGYLLKECLVKAGTKQTIVVDVRSMGSLAATSAKPEFLDPETLPGGPPFGPKKLYDTPDYQVAPDIDLARTDAVTSNAEKALLQEIGRAHV